MGVAFSSAVVVESGIPMYIVQKTQGKLKFLEDYETQDTNKTAVYLHYKDMVKRYGKLVNVSLLN